MSRIALFHPSFAVSGGAEFLIASQAKALLADGHDLRLVTGGYDAGRWDALLSGIPVATFGKARHLSDLAMPWDRVGKVKPGNMRLMEVIPPSATWPRPAGFPWWSWSAPRHPPRRVPGGHVCVVRGEALACLVCQKGTCLLEGHPCMRRLDPALICRAIDEALIAGVSSAMAHRGGDQAIHGWLQ